MNTRKKILVIAFILDSICWIALGFLLGYSLNALGENTMPKLTNSEVINAWTAGQEGVSHTGALSTDGQKLYSYRLVIGDTFDGEKIALDYTASVGQFQSMTTSQHVGLAKRAVDSADIMHPEAYGYVDALRDF